MTGKNDDSSALWEAKAITAAPLRFRTDLLASYENGDVVIWTKAGAVVERMTLAMAEDLAADLLNAARVGRISAAPESPTKCAVCSGSGGDPLSITEDNPDSEFYGQPTAPCPACNGTGKNASSTAGES